MSTQLIVSPRDSINKTRNAILRMKKCSPKLRIALRQRCQERIQQERSKILNTLRKVTIQDSFRKAFGSIISEEWKNIEDDELYNDEPVTENLMHHSPMPEFNIDEELFLEEMLEKELLCEHEEWLLQQYEELLNEELENSNNVVCPLCCFGYLQSKNPKNVFGPSQIECSKCLETFSVDKSVHDLQSAIYKCLKWHDKQCAGAPGFINVPKNENESNLCIICDHCSFLNVVT